MQLSTDLNSSQEYKKRYGKLHSSEGALLWLKDNVPCIPNNTITDDIALAMPGIYKNRYNPTQSYKLYLFHEKSGVLKWSRGHMPEWYRQMCINSNRFPL